MRNTLMRLARRNLLGGSAGLATLAALEAISGLSTGRAAQPTKAESTAAKRTAMTENDDMHWVGTWTTTPDPMEGMALSG